MEREPLLSEADEVEWRGFLSQFREEIFPMFKEHGISFEAALMLWMSNKIVNAVDASNPSDEPWSEE